MKRKAKRKAEVKLLNKLVTLSEYQELLESDTYPLAIQLNEEETYAFKKCKQCQNFLNLNESFRTLLDFYLMTSNPDDKSSVRFYMNAYTLREKIAMNEVFVSTFIDSDDQVRFVDYISESYGYDFDAPRIVFRKNPRRVFRKWDYYDENKDDNTLGKDLCVLAHTLILRDK